MSKKALVDSILSDLAALFYCEKYKSRGAFSRNFRRIIRNSFAVRSSYIYSKSTMNNTTEANMNSSSAGTENKPNVANQPDDSAYIGREFDVLTTVVIEPKQRGDGQSNEVPSVQLDLQLEDLPFRPKKVSFLMVPPDPDWYARFYLANENTLWSKIQPDDFFVCHFCKFPCSTFKYLEYHLNKHLNLYPYKCPVPGCDRYFPSRNFTGHLRGKEHNAKELASKQHN